MQRYMVMDYETLSLAVLRAKGKKPGVGAHEYAIHESTRARCVAFKIGTRKELPTAKTRLWVAHSGKKLPEDFTRALADPTVKLVAHNAGFEQLITKFVLPKHMGGFQIKTPIERWECTAAMAAAHALPRDLERACEVLNLKHKKNPRGKLLIQRHCIPRKPSKNNPAIWNDDPEGLDELAAYCRDDVDAETELFLTLPQLIPMEQKIWQLNQRINQRGIYIDRPLVGASLKLMAEESRDLNTRALEISGGIRPTQRVKMIDVLSDLGCTLPNLQAKTVSDAIGSGLAKGLARELLEIRQAISKSSTAKLMAMWLRSASDSRARDLQLYHGARTGREAGTGLQPHNLPARTGLDDVEGAMAIILEQDRAWLRAIHGSVMRALSACIRGCIRATPGRKLYCADFNAIEARVLFWMARHAEGLKLFTSGVDPYIEQAAMIFGLLYEEIGNPSFERFVGKESILGSGFQMGWKKFKLTLKAKGIDISDELAQKAVATYRKKHAPVVKMWSNIEKAAIEATRNPGKSYSVNRTKWFVKGKFLYAELPSGRRIAFFGPTVRLEEKWGKNIATLYHWGIEKHQWVNRGTYGGKLVENVVQAVARDLMKEAELRIEDAGYIPLIDVHDEILTEPLKKKKDASIEEFEKLMAKLPAWADGLPVKVKGWSDERYRK